MTLGKFPFESVANWSLIRARFKLSAEFSYQAIPVNDSRESIGKHTGVQQSTKPNKKVVHPSMPEFGCQKSRLVA
jgi:hypothetical protein